MNIIILDKEPELCAKYYTDTHVVNLLTNYTQLLSNAYHATGVPEMAPYKPFNIDTDVSRWVCESQENWTWLYYLNLYVYMEYLRRFGNKIHKAGQISMDLSKPSLPNRGLTPFVTKVPEECVIPGADAITNYRNYYRMYMRDPKLYKRSRMPDWLEGGLEEDVNLSMLRIAKELRGA